MGDPWDAVARGARQVVQGAAEREARRGLQRVVPRVFWPLIPGMGGSIRTQLEGAARRTAIRWVVGLGFGAAVAAMLVGLAAAALVAVLATVWSG